MQISKIIEAAQVQRGIIPQTFVCGCCGDELDRDEHMRGHYLPEFEEAVFNLLGPNVCAGCADIMDKKGRFEADEDDPEYGADDRYDEWKEAQV